MTDQRKELHACIHACCPGPTNARAPDVGDDAVGVVDLDPEVVKIVFEFAVAAARLIGIVDASDPPPVGAPGFGAVPGSRCHLAAVDKSSADGAGRCGPV